MLSYSQRTIIKEEITYDLKGLLYLSSGLQISLIFLSDRGGPEPIFSN